jgi:hypothetical protein
MVWDAGNTIWLLPAYTFGTADGGLYTVIAVDDAFIQQPDPNTTTTEPAIDPNIAPPVVEPTVAISGTDVATGAPTGPAAGPASSTPAAQPQSTNAP